MAVNSLREKGRTAVYELEGPRSSLSIHPFTRDAAQRWDEFVMAQPGGSPFHLSAWKVCLEKTFGYESCYFYAKRDGEITAIAPVFYISNWIVGRCLLSTPFAVYGGICAADAESEKALLEHLRSLGVSQQADYLELRYRERDPLEGFSPVSRYVTFTKELLPDPEANLKRLPKDTRYMIRKSIKAGLRAERGFDQLDVFYKLFACSMKRLGTPVFPEALFENLIEEFAGITDLTIIYSGNQAVAGVFSFFFRDAILPYYAGASEEANSLAANNFMYWDLMKYAIEKGVRQFDFGRSKKGTGAYDFKSQWAMNEKPLNYQMQLIRRKEVPNFSPLNPKFQLATRMWNRLPLRLTTWLGPRVVRWFP